MGALVTDSFPEIDFWLLRVEHIKQRLKNAWVYEIVRDNFVYFPTMKHLWHGRVDFSMINEFTVWNLISINND